jgi:hypothetical protein
MLQTLIHHPAACFIIGLLFIVALTFGANRLGLIAWLWWLDHRKSDRCQSNRGDRKHHGEATSEYWSIHQ